MIMNATVVVQVVIAWLLGASVLTWALLFSKLTYFSGLGSKTDRFLHPPSRSSAGPMWLNPEVSSAAVNGAHLANADDR